MTIGGSNLCVFESVIICFNLFFFVFNLLLLNTAFASPTRHLCRPDQKNALMEFRNEFQIFEPCHDSICSFKTKSWKNSSDCCSWDGVTCDVDSGVVTGLDLSSGRLYGPLKPNSSLFRLKHLQSLNLASNYFIVSSIPSEFGNLTRLTQLNLSYSSFSGRIPNELLQLTGLVTLDLCGEGTFTETPFLSTLARNLTNLQELGLSNVNISSTVPKGFANMSSLRFLDLINGNLLGEFPRDVFLLPHIESVDVSDNQDLIGSLPEFPTNSSLRHLALASTNFYGSLSDSIGNLKSLEWLELSSANFSGSLPDSIGNLKSLERLDLSFSNFFGSLLDSIGNLKSLERLDLSSSNFFGSLPDSIGNLKSLERLDLSFANFSGSLPDSIGNLTSLEWLDLSYNNFVGQIPSSIRNLSHLNALDLSYNKFTGSFPLESLNLTKIQMVNLAHNKLAISFPSNTGLDVSNANASLTSDLPSSLKRLLLPACNITEIPSFLRTQRSLGELDLSNNKIKGQVPRWIWELPSLASLNLSYNSLSHLEGSSKDLSAGFVSILDLSSNAFQGPLPAPPMSTMYLLLSANNFSGNIPPAICKLSSLATLDLSNNNLSGLIPQCLGNVSDYLSIISLRNNHLSGSLPDTFIRCQSLLTLDVGHNKLAGKLPRSLLNCTYLEVLNVESNGMSDTYPFWLEDLLELQVLILRSNGFHGPLVSSTFSKLRIIDVSHNNFFGALPSDYFANWSALSSVKTNESNPKFGYLGYGYSKYYTESMVFTTKGTQMMFERILLIFKAVDFSGNRFQGQIPDSIGLFKELITLNFSNNHFKGHIPQSLANLTELESLDLSQNKLSGIIPPELGDIARLSRINFSHNQLTGAIPQGPQFTTQDSSSFEGNPGLCGLPLQQTCDANTSPARPNQKPETQEEVVSWIAVIIGYIPGLVFGLTIGHIMASYKHEWFLKVFGLNRRRRIRTR